MSHMFHRCFFIMLERHITDLELDMISMCLLVLESYVSHLSCIFLYFIFAETNERCDIDNCFQAFHFQTSSVICAIGLYSSVQNTNI